MLIKLLRIVIISHFMSKNVWANSEFTNAQDHEYGLTATNQIVQNYPLQTIPKPQGGKIVTLNKTGYMKTEIDPYSKRFLAEAEKSKGVVLEIGAAFGVVAKEALARGATVIANDIDNRHLMALAQSTPKQFLPKLYLNNKIFPWKTSFKENSLKAILMSRVAHFLTPEEIELALTKCHNWLAPGGKLFFVAMSPYHHLLREKFLPIYLSKMKAKQQWPGVIDNMHQLNAQEAKDIPNFLHVFEPVYMTDILKRAGFTIEQIELFDYSNFSSEGKGYLGFVVVK